MELLDDPFAVLHLTLQSITRLRGHAVQSRVQPDLPLAHRRLNPDVADGRRSVILDQVTNGVAVRMALLYLVLGGSGGSEVQGESR